MKNIRHLPSYLVPTYPIEIEGLKIERSVPVTVLDDWNRPHWSASLTVEEDGYGGKIDRWIYFHSLLAGSRLPLYAFQAFGHSESDFRVQELDPEKYPNIAAREMRLDFNNILPGIYWMPEIKEVSSYSQIYNAYLGMDDVYIAALKNYFLAQDIDFNKRLRFVDPAYWQVVMLISAMEALLPRPEFCKGKCEVCEKGVNHPINNADKDWKELLFSRIASKEIRKQYRLIFDVARSEIRNNTVHNGLMPALIVGRASLKDGVTEYTTQKAIEEYRSDDNSLVSLVEQLRQMCRYVLLNALIKKDIFPALKGTEVHSVTIKANSSPVTINLDF
jgi:hypothetical protein